jgi:hypothetical protein
VCARAEEEEGEKVRGINTPTTFDLICTRWPSAPIQMRAFAPSLLLPWYKCAFRFTP